MLKKPSLLPKSTASRNPPRKRDIPDEINTFNELDNITNLEILNELPAPAGFSFKKFDDYVLFYRIFYEESNATPFIESINVDKDLRVKLHYKGSAIPLPTWFKDINRYKITSVSTLKTLFHTCIMLLKNSYNNPG